MEDVPDPGHPDTVPNGSGDGHDGHTHDGHTHDGHTHDGHTHGDEECGEALAELYTFLDGELTEQRRRQIAHHLDDCSPCLEAYDFEAELRLVIRQRCRDDVPESLMRRLGNALSAEQADPSPSAGGPAPA